MIDYFEFYLQKKVDSPMLIAAISDAYNLNYDQVSLHTMEPADFDLPLAKLVCFVFATGNEPFQTLLALNRFNGGVDKSTTSIATRLSHLLGCDILIPDAIPFDDETMLYLSAYSTPKLVLVYESRDESGGRVSFEIDDYQ